MGEIITFYSYKGGTGRSMALANVGHILAWEIPSPRKVLMIDWDLEAPGLHKFFFNQLKINFSATDIRSYPDALSQAPGLINFLHDISTFYQREYPSEELAVTHAETSAAQTAFSAAISSHPLSKYTLAIVPPGDISSREQSMPGLFLVKAGNQASPEYVNLIRTFEWEKFYRRYGSFFTHFREYLTRVYDTVLVDSRTGLTDIGDICTRVMPEKLVGVFVPNEQNIEGLIGVLKGAAEYRMNSRDPRSLIIFPLASRIDPARSQLRDAWWKGGTFRNREVVGYEPRFERLMRSIYQLESCDMHAFFDNTQIPHDADYAFGEEVAARDRPSGRLTINYACANLARYLVEDFRPWEEPSTESRQTTVAPMSVGAERSLSRILVRFIAPVALASLGLLIALLAPALEESLFGANAHVPSARVGNLVVTASSADIPGFGVGSATISVNSEGTGLSQPQAVRLDLSRGTITPNTLVLESASLSGPATAVLVSEGLGPAELRITRLAIPPSPAPPDQGTRDDVGLIAIAYRWPIGLTMAAYGGGLLGIALHIGLLLQSPFRRPSGSVIASLIILDIIVSSILVAVYVVAVAPLIESSLRYSTLLIMLLGASGPFLSKQVENTALKQLRKTSSEGQSRE